MKPTPELLALMHTAILAKAAYWDATTAVEKALVPDDDVSDKQANLITDVCESFAVLDNVSAFDMDELVEFLNHFEAAA